MNLPNGYLLQKGKYKLTHVIGQGGFGITYKGIWYTEVSGPLGAVKTEIPVCVKEYFFKDYCYREPDSQAVKVHSETGKALFDKFKEKLIKEAKILSEVHHPYIVNVLEVFEENNTAYIAMEYISGNSLKFLLEREGILPETKVLKYVRQIGEALCFVHEKNILHLDIKPSNVLVDKNDNARLIDFGVSKRYDMGQEETSTTMLTLSKGFASIEQYDSEGIPLFSPRPDIYSLGAMMYNLLTGKIPTESILRATRPLKSPSEINPSISKTTASVIMKAMRIVPEDRYGSVKEMLEALDFSQVKEDAPIPSSFPENESEEEETTVLRISSPKVDSSHDQEEEETILKKIISHEKEMVGKKKKSSKKVVSIGVAIFVVVGSAAVLLVRGDKPVDQKVGNFESFSIELDSDILADVRLADVEIIDPSILHVKPTKAKASNEGNGLREKVGVERQKTAVLESKGKATVSSDVLSSEVDARYDALIMSGREKLSEGDIEGAKTDFSKAKDTKLTEEVVRLIIECDEKIEERRIVNKKAQYEEKMDFGRYKIVRKKVNNRYGAIDSEGNERIPCKYLSVGRADNGRAFEREDNLFDIYNSDGVLISEGLTYY